MTLADAERRAFVTLADVLLPGDGSLPPASSVRIGDWLLDRALAAVPEAARAVRDLLASWDGADPEGTLRLLAERDPARFEAFALVATGAYTMSPRVRKPLGYPGQRSAPVLPDEADYYLDGGILDPVVARGRLYRDAPP